MSYISHEDYKDLMSKFQVGTSKSMLKEAVEEGNAFTAALAKTPKGGKAKIDGQEITDTSNYDDISMKEGSEDKLDAVFNIMNDEMRLNNISEKEFNNAAKYLEKYGTKLTQTGQSPQSIAKTIIKKVQGIKEASSVKESNDEVDSKLERIADLYRGNEVDFETIEKIVKALESQGHEVNARYIQQYLSQHGVKIDEYGYADNYPGSWGYREGEEKPHRSATGRGIRETQKGKGVGLEKEGLHMSPLQATGQTIDTVEENSTMNAPFGVANPGTKKQLDGPGLQLSNLNTDERKQLGEFVDAVKTTKKAIEELLKKASGRDMKVKEDMGGDRTNLVMTPSTVSETKMDPESYVSVESHLDKKLHDVFETVVDKIIKNLEGEGIEGDLIEMFLKHEIEKKAQEATMGQHDLGEGSYKVSKNAVPARSLKRGDIVTNGKEEVVSVSAGARTASGKVDVVLKNIATGAERSVQWGSSTMVSKRPK